MRTGNNNFKECIENFFRKGEFFNKWFREYGKCYLFIFKQNLKVTNLQYAELISLIRANCIIDSPTDNNSIQFLTVKDFVESTERLFNSFAKKIINVKMKPDEIAKYELIYKKIEECYESIFNNIIVVDAFYGSCAIFLPHNIKLDIEKVCALSGYIHSCGENIFTRRIGKANKEFFFERLEEYHRKKYLKSAKKKIPFTLYCHEDFTPYDREDEKNFLVNGLDGIKFYAEKLYMQSTPLTKVIDEMKEHKYFKKHLDVAKAGDYHENIKGDNPNSIWLIADRAASEYSPDHSSKKDIFLMCYNQLFINENPFHLFDENKPGWIDHTTIPHTLMGAMLNISIPIAREGKIKRVEIDEKVKGVETDEKVKGVETDEKVKGVETDEKEKVEKIFILDPFVGSGTTYLEQMKFSDIEFSGSDLSNLSVIVAEDNLRFFSLSYSELNEVYLMLLNLELKVYELLNLELKVYKDRKGSNYDREVEFIKLKIAEKIAEIDESNNEKLNKNKAVILSNQIRKINTPQNQKNADTIYDSAMDYIIELDEAVKDEVALLNSRISDVDILSKIDLSVFEAKLITFNERLLFYVCLKAYKRNVKAFDRKSKDWNSAFIKELAELRSQVNNFSKLRKRTDVEYVDKSTVDENTKDVNIKKEVTLIECLSNYSRGCSINPKIFIELNKSGQTKVRIKGLRDVLDELNESKNSGTKYDIIITDPPYGFNTEEETKKFADLYSEMIKLMIQCLSPNGQLLLCLPEFSNTGRQIRFFTQKEVVISQIIVAASENKRTLVLPVNVLPSPAWLFKAPYYWESEKALRRSILHFIVK